MNNIEQKLKEHQLRITPIRIELLSYFIQSKNAISHAEIEKHCDHKFDRVTIYRTIYSFIEQGLLHKVLDGSNIAKYALCKHTSCAHNHEDNHVHFKCVACEKVECLHQINIPYFKLPKNYSVSSTNLLIEGKCSSCN